MREMQIDVLLAGHSKDGTRKVTPHVRCPLCEQLCAPEQVILRIWDFKNGPGVREIAIHKACLVLLMDVSVDDSTPTDAFDYRDQLLEPARTLHLN